MDVMHIIYINIFLCYIKSCIFLILRLECQFNLPKYCAVSAHWWWKYFHNITKLPQALWIIRILCVVYFGTMFQVQHSAGFIPSQNWLQSVSNNTQDGYFNHLWIEEGDEKLFGWKNTSSVCVKTATDQVRFQQLLNFMFL